MDDEKKLAIKFFKTHIGKETLKRLKEANDSNATIVELNRKIRFLETQLEMHDVPTSKDEIQIQKQLNKATSLFQSDKRPQYLFGIINEVGEVQGLYTNQLEKIRKSLVYEDTKQEEENGYE